MVITKAQRAALKRIWLRTVPDGIFLPEQLTPYRKFRRTVVATIDCIMVPFCGMWLGIESDGYTHS